MMDLDKHTIFFIVLIISLIYYTSKIDSQIIDIAKKFNNTQEYKLKVRYINPCNSREILNKKYVTTYNISVKTDQKEEEIHGTVTVPHTQKVIKGSVTFDIWRNGAYYRLVNKTSLSPCSDPLLSIPLYVVHHADIQCIIKEGSYKIHDLFLNKLTHLAIGNKFVSGRFQGKVEYFSKKNIFSCIELVSDIIPLSRRKTN